MKLRVWWSRLIDLVLKRQRDVRLSEELNAHLEQLSDEHIARGMSPEEARFAARREFGGLEQVKSHYRDQRGFPSLESWRQDVAFALRVFRRDRGFALSATLILGLGIGVYNLFFMLVYAHTMRGLPIPDAERVLYVSSLIDRANDRPISSLDYQDLIATQRSFIGLAAFVSLPVGVGDDGPAPERMDGTYLTSNTFGLLRVAPVVGRDFTPEDDRPGAAPVVMLGASAWQSRYARDPGIVGRPILVNGLPATVIGIMPDRSGFPSTSTIWLPLSLRPGDEHRRRDARSLRVFGRLRDGVGETAARNEIVAIVEGLAQAYPQTNANVAARVMPIDRRYTQRLEGAWIAFLSAGVLVMLISFANVANLMLARAQQRTREIAIRSSLGANRLRVMRQLLVESAVLGGFGCLVGLAFSLAGARLVKSAIPASFLPYWNEYYLDARVTASLILVSFAAVLIFGLIPAAQAARTDVNRVLKDGGRSGTGGRQSRRWTTTFLAAELALAIVLLGQLGLSWRLTQPDLPGDIAVNTPDIVTATVTLPADKYRSTDHRVGFYNAMAAALGGEALENVSLASFLPRSGGQELGLEIEGRQRETGAAAPSVWMVAVGPHYFDTIRMPLVKGRALVDADGRTGQLNTMVNQRLAEMYFGDVDAIGQRIALRPAGANSGPPAWHTIVGVTSNVRQRATSEVEPTVYFPLSAVAPATVSILWRSSLEPAAAAGALRQAAVSVDPTLPLYRVQTMTQVISDLQWAGRVSIAMANTLTFIALLLATVGLYAVTAHNVARRAKEIGVRMALGARAGRVVRSVVATVRVPLAMGFTIGVIGIVAWDRAFASGRAGVRASDPEAIALVAVLVALITCVACAVPARRATRLDPVAVLRED